jgi:hypothetical protein
VLADERARGLKQHSAPARQHVEEERLDTAATGRVRGVRLVQIGLGAQGPEPRMQVNTEARQVGLPADLVRRRL